MALLTHCVTIDTERVHSAALLTHCVTIDTERVYSAAVVTHCVTIDTERVHSAAVVTHCVTMDCLLLAEARAAGPSLKHVAGSRDLTVMLDGVTSSHLSSAVSGWESRVDSHGRIFYIDHINRMTTWTRPRRSEPVTRMPSIRDEDRRQMARRYDVVADSILWCCCFASTASSVGKDPVAGVTLLVIIV